MSIAVFNYFEETSSKEISGQAFFFEDGTYASKFYYESECHGYSYPRINKITIIRPNGKKELYHLEGEYYELLASKGISRLRAGLLHGEFLIAKKTDRSKNNYEIVNITLNDKEIKPKQQEYYKKLEARASSLKDYDDVINYYYREMHKLAEGFYIEEKESLKTKKVEILKNNTGIINVSNLVNNPVKSLTLEK